MRWRNSLMSLAVASVLVLAGKAQAIDPIRNPGSPGLTNPQSTSPLYPPGTGSPSGTFGNAPGSFGNPTGTFGSPFDPFAPTLPAGTTIPGGSSVAPRVAPNPQPQPGPNADPPKWRLGVFSMDTDTGVRVVKIVQGSPAAAAGLEVDDNIVAVSGLQVGYIDGRRSEMGTVFNEKADANGYVLMLVQDHRSKGLINLPVQLDSRFERIQGTVSYRDGSRLPRTAQVSLELRERIRQGGPVVPLVSKTIDNIQQVPIPFALDFDPSLIDPRRQYEVHAAIYDEGRPIYTTRTPYRVITEGYPRTVDLTVYSTGSQYTSPTGYASSREEEIEKLYTLFNQYLDREPRRNEEAVYTSQLDRGGQLLDMQAELLGSNEFYTLSNRDKTQYVTRLFQVVLGRQPRQDELNGWIARLDQNNGLRRDMAREFLMAVSDQN